MPIRTAALVLIPALLGAGGGGPGEIASTADGMAVAAQPFLVEGGEVGRAQARLAFDSDQRFEWYYTPRERHGVPLKRMSPEQRRTAFELLRAGLSEKGYTKAETIIALETVLAGMGGNPAVRDPELYYVSVFGDPVPGGTWGWRLEGHHLSLHWTVVGGNSLASTPQFLGANPAEVRQGAKTGLRTLRAEEDLARSLVRSLSDEQGREAVVSDVAPDEILTANQRQAAIEQGRGLLFARMGESQRGLLLALLEEYASVQRPAVAAERLRRIREAGLDRVVFAWSGGLERGQGHYYRIQGPTFLIEYDNTQNGANHIHTVWRDFRGDFGRDRLAEHYRTSDHHR